MAITGTKALEVGTASRRTVAAPPRRAGGSRTKAARSTGVRKDADSGTGKRKHVGWREFRDQGGPLLAEIHQTGVPAAIGTGKLHPQVRLRAASKAPKTARKVLPEHRLTYDAVVKQLPQFRIVIGIGRPVLIRHRDGSRVVADRHPDFTPTLIEPALTSLRAQVYEKLIKALFKDIEPPKSSGAVTPKSPNGPPNLQNMLDAASKTGLDEDSFVQMLKQWAFSRGADAAVADAAKPTEKNLDGFRED
jgi:hypothetical protein